MWETVVVWEDGEKTVYEFKTQEDAERCERNMRMAFGNQVSWCGVRERR